MKLSLKRKLIFSSIIFASSLILMLAVLELAVRFLHPEILTFKNITDTKRYSFEGKSSDFVPVYAPSPILSYQYRPNLKLTVEDRIYGGATCFVTNELGFRPWRTPKGDEFKIMVLGDSVTYGIGAGNEEDYPSQLQKKMGSGVQVYNLGIGGYGFAEYYILYKQYNPQFKPDLLIIGTIPHNDTNDLQSSEWPGWKTGALPVPPLIRREYYIDSNGELRKNDWVYRVPFLRNSKAFVYIAHALDNRLSKKNIRSEDESRQLAKKIISGIAEDFGKKLLLIIFPTMDELERGEIHVNDEFAASLNDIPNLFVLNLSSKIQAADWKHLYADKIHLNSAGNRLAADEIASFLHSQKLDGTAASPSSEGAANPKN